MEVYLDNSATTKCYECVRDLVGKIMCDDYGNPSSMHKKGVDAEKYVRESKETLAKLLKVQEKELVFTSGGTESDNLALIGCARANRRAGNHLITSSIEHPAILNTMQYLEKEEGFRVTYLPVDRDGRIKLQALKEALCRDTILVSIMYVNNEVGSVLPINTIRKAIKRNNSPAIIHSDCIQALGKIPISPKTIDADIITVSGHKIHALKGVGGIYLKSKGIIKPYVLGGGQEQNLHSGTEATPAIMSFGAAAEEAMDINAHSEYVKTLKNRLVNGIIDIPCVEINSPEDAIPYILNISILGLPSQPIVNFMSEKGISISAGSACKMGHRSPVLTAMGLSPERIDSAVRISLSRFNTEEEIDYLISAIKEASEKYGKKQR